MKHKSPCRCCGDLVSDISKRFDEHCGYVCAPCHEALDLAHVQFTIAGMTGVAGPADRTKHLEVLP